jgi:hypothetical protein
MIILHHTSASRHDDMTEQATITSTPCCHEVIAKGACAQEMISENEADRQNLISLAQLYCESFNYVAPAVDNFELSTYTSNLFDNTLRKLDGALGLVVRLRDASMTNELKNQELLALLTDRCSALSAADDR